MRYEFIAANEGEYGVKRMCQALEVTRSGYYAWRNHPVGIREQANRELTVQIRQEHQDSRQTYGSPRIHAALQRKGVVCGRKRVARLMRMHEIVARKPRKRYPITTQR
jgi:hypothetical protein